MESEVGMLYFTNRNPSHFCMDTEGKKHQRPSNFSTYHHSKQSMFKDKQACELHGRRVNMAFHRVWLQQQGEKQQNIVQKSERTENQGYMYKKKLDMVLREEKHAYVNMFVCGLIVWKKCLLITKMMLLCHLIPTISRENDNIAPFQKKKSLRTIIWLCNHMFYTTIFFSLKKKKKAPLLLDSCLSHTANMDNIRKNKKMQEFKVTVNYLCI